MTARLLALTVDGSDAAGGALSVLIEGWDTVVVFRKDGAWRTKIGTMVSVNGGIGGQRFDVAADVRLASGPVGADDALDMVLTGRGAVAGRARVARLGTGRDAGWLIEAPPQGAGLSGQGVGRASGEANPPGCSCRYQHRSSATCPSPAPSRGAVPDPAR